MLKNSVDQAVFYIFITSGSIMLIEGFFFNFWVKEHSRRK